MSTNDEKMAIAQSHADKYGDEHVIVQVTLTLDYEIYRRDVEVFYEVDPESADWATQALSIDRESHKNESLDVFDICGDSKPENVIFALKEDTVT
jgi:hypothetical protein